MAWDFDGMRPNEEEISRDRVRPTKRFSIQDFRFYTGSLHCAPPLVHPRHIPPQLPPFLISYYRWSFHPATLPPLSSPSQLPRPSTAPCLLLLLLDRDTTPILRDRGVQSPPGSMPRACLSQLVLFRFREVSMRCARSRGSTPRTSSFSEIVGSLRSGGAAGIDARIMFRGEEMYISPLYFLCAATLRGRVRSASRIFVPQAHAVCVSLPRISSMRVAQALPAPVYSCTHASSIVYSAPTHNLDTPPSMSMYSVRPSVQPVLGSSPSLTRARSYIVLSRLRPCPRYLPPSSIARRAGHIQVPLHIHCVSVPRNDGDKRAVLLSASLL
ncbi:hypothetical protein B0H13DRAFT_2371959 [Mycena leptocephala]|nr:hypothetical protein B0H13DRAFT_2371959 [Mycena leptocephala]